MVWSAESPSAIELYLQRRHHLPFLLTVKNVVMVLHRDEGSQVVGDRIVLHRVELIRIARAHSDVADVARFDHIVQSLHSFLDRGLIIEAMALKDVDIVEIESLQASLDAIKDMLSTEAGLISTQEADTQWTHSNRRKVVY